MGKLICICNNAGTMVCHSCPKGAVIKPDQVRNISAWSKVSFTSLKQAFDIVREDNNFGTSIKLKQD